MSDRPDPMSDRSDPMSDRSDPMSDGLDPMSDYLNPMSDCLNLTWDCSCVTSSGAPKIHCKALFDNDLHQKTPAKPPRVVASHHPDATKKGPVLPPGLLKISAADQMMPAFLSVTKAPFLLMVFSARHDMPSADKKKIHGMSDGVLVPCVIG